jgi:hypothetical protein
MKRLGLFIIVVLAISVVGLPFVYYSCSTGGASSKEFYFGVSYGQSTVKDAKLLIDKVKGYTNFFLVDSWPLCLNETALNEVCDYASNAGLRFMVFFDFISNQTYAWHHTWLDAAKQRWGDMFLGIYLYDEPGGKQIDAGGWDEGRVPSYFKNAKSPSEAAEVFTSLGQSQSFNDVKSRGIPVFTSDYALYWYDYQAGYSSIFVELGSNNSRTEQIALCRGAANSFGKDWGAIITWTYNQPPYIASGQQILQDMHTAYDAGAKYVIVFNYCPTYPVDNPYGTLTEEHFAAMQQFWNYVKTVPHGAEKVTGQVVLILPEYYGGGLRRIDDNVWGPENLTWRSTWPVDTQSTLIWDNMNTLADKYGLSLNIIYDCSDIVTLMKQYSKVYWWNGTPT